MDCAHVRGRLVGWLDGELARGEQEQLERHLDGCERCTAEAARYSEQQEALLAIKAPQRGLAPGFWDGMDAVLASELDRQERGVVNTAAVPLWRRRVALSPLTLAAYAAVLLLAVGYGWSKHEEAGQARVDAEVLRVELERQQRLMAESPTRPPSDLYRQVSYVNPRGTF